MFMPAMSIKAHSAHSFWLFMRAAQRRTVRSLHSVHSPSQPLRNPFTHFVFVTLSRTGVRDVPSCVACPPAVLPTAR